MAHIGKEIRLLRLKDVRSGKYLFVPMDHGVSLGPVTGLVNMPSTIQSVASGGATSVVLHRGMVEGGFRRGGKDIGLVVNLSASTTVGKGVLKKVLVTSVEDAIALGADGVSVHLNLGSDTEDEMIRDLGKTVCECTRWGMPLVAMIYPRGPDIGNEFDPDLVKHCARMANELGADVVVTNYTGDPASFKDVTRSCTIPVLVGGAPRLDSDKALLTMVSDSLKAGGMGVAIGRNIFQHAKPKQMTRAIKNIVGSKWTVTKSLNLLK